MDDQQDRSRREKQPKVKPSARQKGACVASLWAELLLPMARRDGEHRPAVQTARRRRRTRPPTGIKEPNMTGMQRCRQPVGETWLQRKFGFVISTCVLSSQRCGVEFKSFQKKISSATVLQFSNTVRIYCEMNLPKKIYFISHF